MRGVPRRPARVRPPRLRLDAEQRAAVGRALGLSDRSPARTVALGTSADVVDRHGHPRRGQEPDRGRARRRGYLRLNRDEPAARCATSQAPSTTRWPRARGGRPRQHLPHPSRRNEVVEAAGRHGAAARCIWLDTPLAQAQINLVERLLDRGGSLPDPETLRGLAGGSRPAPPTSQMRTLASSSRLGMTRASRASNGRRSRARRTGGIAAGRVRRGGGAAPRGVGARPWATRPRMRRTWCSTGTRTATGPRSRLPPAGCRDGVGARGGRALPARRRAAALLVPAAASGPSAGVRQGHSVDPSGSLLVGAGAAHRSLAAALGALYVQVP